MDDSLKVWTTVGSAGSMDQADLAKVHLTQSIVQLGVDLGSTQGATAAARAIVPTTQAVIRYNVTAVDGLFFSTAAFTYQLQVRYRGHVSAKLMQVNINTGEETQLVLFDSTHFPSTSSFQLQRAAAPMDSAFLDFVNNGYYVEAALTTSAVVIGKPSAISVIQLFATPDFKG